MSNFVVLFGDNCFVILSEAKNLVLDNRQKGFFGFASE